MAIALQTKVNDSALRSVALEPGEPSVTLQAGWVIEAKNPQSALSTYALRTAPDENQPEGGNYCDGESFMVLGAPQEIAGERFIGGSSSFGVKKYVPVIQLSDTKKAYVGGVVWVRIEDDVNTRRRAPRFRVLPHVASEESVLEILGQFGLSPELV